MTEPLALLNVYDVETEHGPASLICFLDPVRAGATGIDPRSVVGEYAAGEAEGFDVEAFRVNPAFVEALTGYMNAVAATSGEVVAQARELSKEWLYVIDPRDQTEPPEEPPGSNILGAFAVDEAGQVVPWSFQYNEKHALFSREHGTSAVLFDRRFYDWMYPPTA